MTIYFLAFTPLILFVYLMLRIGNEPLSWRLLAWVATREKVFVWLLRRAFRTPYSHITSADGTDVYMKRYWLFNPYATEDGARAGGSDAAPRRSWWRERLPSVRIHHIRRADQDRHLHSHPWNARTIILRGWYEEERYMDETATGAAHRQIGYVNGGDTVRHVRIAGYTGRLLFGQYHRITAVPRDGVWTLFITWRKRGSWGFDVDGHEVPWREYLNPPELEDFLRAGWTREQLLNGGYAEAVTVTRGETRTLYGTEASLHNIPKPTEQTR